VGGGAFAVLIALGGAGTDAAIGMIVIQLLTNGILQQMVQPIAYGAALGIHPLAVLIVTIAGGGLFGAVGLILAAPLTSAATRVAGDLSRSRAAASPPQPDPGAAAAT
jgi:putative heme transporter